MNQLIAKEKRNWRRLMASLACRAMILSFAGCAAGVAVAVGAAVVVGLWVGTIAVNFPQNSTANRISGLSGESRLSIQEDANKVPQLASYKGILPGFLEVGATNASVDLNTGQVTGTVTNPAGATYSLSDLLPGLQATRDDSRTSRTAAMAFSIQFTSGDTTYYYRIIFDVDPNGSGTSLTGDVRVQRRTIKNGIVLLDETGTGGINAIQATDDEFNQSLPAPPVPIQVNAGQDATINAGASTTLQGSASGGTGTLSYSWSPAAGLSSSSVLQPAASPTGTTVYRLTVTDSNGQQATDDVTVTVTGGTTPPPLYVNAGEDKSIISGGVVKLEGSASGGVAPLTYSWTPTAGLDNPASLQPNAGPSATTTYRLTVTDSQGQQVHDDVNVVVTAPPSQNALDIKAYYNGSLLQTIGLASNPPATALKSGPQTILGYSLYGLFIAVNSMPQINLELMFDSPGDASGPMAATDIHGMMGFGYFYNDSNDPSLVTGVYDNSDVYSPIGPEYRHDPVGTIDLRSINGRLVGTFDVSMSHQPESASQPNTLRWVGNINLPDNFYMLGDMIITLP